jgi:hypothetical protein
MQMARFTDLTSTVGAGIRSELVCRPITALPVTARSKLAPVVHDKMYGAVLTGGNAD